MDERIDELDGSVKTDRSEGNDRRLRNKAYWLVHSYLDQHAVCEQCREELASLPIITWQDACVKLCGGDPFSERVQTSNISDQTCKIALNVEDEIARMNWDIRKEPTRKLKAATENVSVLEAVFEKVKVLESLDEYKETGAFVEQFCREGRRITEIKSRSGWRMSRYQANQEKDKVVRLIVEELKYRKGRLNE